MADIATTTPKHRSPAYPTFGLRTAVEKAKIYYDDQKRNSVHVDVATETLGYKMRSGSGLRAIAALISFGLMSEEGSGPSRKVRLTPLAIKILLLPDGDSERMETIQQAAQRPKIYHDMLEMWPNGLPSDSAMQKHLTFEKDFNPEAVGSLIRDFKDTYAYANLQDLGIISAENAGLDIPEDAPARETFNDQTGTISRAGIDSQTQDAFGRGGPVGRESKIVQHQQTFIRQQDHRSLNIPITGGRTAVLSIPSEVTQDDFKFLTTYLRLMKDAIVTGKVTDETVEENDEEE